MVRQHHADDHALRGHLAEYGAVAPQFGRARSGTWSECSKTGTPATEAGRRLSAGRTIDELDEKINGLDRELRASARENEETARLMTIPRDPPRWHCIAPPMESFRCGR